MFPANKYGYLATAITMNIVKKWNSINCDEIEGNRLYVKKINKIIIHKARKYIPYKTVTIRSNDPPPSHGSQIHLGN